MANDPTNHRGAPIRAIGEAPAWHGHALSGGCCGGIGWGMERMRPGAAAYIVPW